MATAQLKIQTPKLESLQISDLAEQRKQTIRFLNSKISQSLKNDLNEYLTRLNSSISKRGELLGYTGTHAQAQFHALLAA